MYLDIFIGQNVNIMQLLIKGALLGLGLTMDACAISMANGLQESRMPFKKMLFIAFMYGLFQGMMPLIGYFFGNLLYENLPFIKDYYLIPILSLLILLFLGIKMIIDGVKQIKLSRTMKTDSKEIIEKDNIVLKQLTFKVILLQAIATSIDALSSGLTFSQFNILEALLLVLIISLITFSLCMVALFIGKKFGDKLGAKAILIGGIILVVIGIEIFVTGIWL
jgi:putative Mn2+ efflux pump MntP